MITYTNMSMNRAGQGIHTFESRERALSKLAHVAASIKS